MPRKVDLEALFEAQLRGARINGYERQVAIHPFRRWRLDFAWPPLMVALEIQGGTWVQGGHSRGRGYEADCDKANAATLLGWRLLRVTGNQVWDGRALEVLRAALSAPPRVLPPSLRAPPVRGRKGTFHRARGSTG